MYVYVVGVRFALEIGDYLFTVFELTVLELH